MSNYKILVKITGSIAAYKSAYLISKLVQDGNEVRVVATKSALEFLGKATLEGLTSNPVYTDSFEESRMMSHISLVKWADLTIVVPASANTINKLAQGIGDNLLTSLFLAHDMTKPYLVAPAMNTAMFDHPATQESIKKLESWGVKILPTGDGYLACGDYGRGKLLEPDQIIRFIYSTLKRDSSHKSVLITSGGTKENIDGIRHLSNLSTGKTASRMAQHFIDNNYDVYYLHAPDSVKPAGNYRQSTFTDFRSLNSSLKEILSENNFDLMIHNAAVSDYSIDEILIDGQAVKPSLNSKLESGGNELVLKLKPNFKIVSRLKDYSLNKNVALIAFKFTNDINVENRAMQVKKLFDSADIDYVVQNDFNDRKVGNQQSNFNFYSNPVTLTNFSDVEQLVQAIEKSVFNFKNTGAMENK